MEFTGRDLKAERVRRGLTQAELGARLHISARRISNAENALRVTPTFVARYTAAVAADVPAADRLEQITAQFLAELETLDPADGETVP